MSKGTFWYNYIKHLCLYICLFFSLCILASFLFIFIGKTKQKIIWMLVNAFCFCFLVVLFSFSACYLNGSLFIIYVSDQHRKLSLPLLVILLFVCFFVLVHTSVIWRVCIVAASSHLLFVWFRPTLTVLASIISNHNACLSSVFCVLHYL